jgi:RHS repeat-associated protein
VPAINEGFAYDGGGLMVSRSVGLATRYMTWDYSSLSLLLSDGQNSYVYGPGGLPVEQISAGEAPTYLHHDQLGSTRALTNATGEISATFTYGPYGGVTGHTGSATTPLGFAGQYTTSQSGLQYLRARFYDPATAQFLTNDPILDQTRQPYAYARDDPSGNVDRSGLEAEELPCIWPICAPPPVVVEPVEDVANAFDEFGDSVFGGSDEIAGNVTIAANVLESRSQESDAEGGCEPDGDALKREGENILGRKHSDAAGQRWQEWWEGLRPGERKAYGRARGPKPRGRN